MQKDFQHFITYERKKMQAQLELSNELVHSLRATLKHTKTTGTLDELILTVAKDLSEYVFRIYICNEEGLQQSSNVEKDQEGVWQLKKEGLYKNWSWRPYFLENIVRMNVEKKEFYLIYIRILSETNKFAHLHILSLNLYICSWTFHMNIYLNKTI